MPFKKKLNKLYNWWVFGAGIFLVTYLCAVWTQVRTTFGHITSFCHNWLTACPVYVRPIVIIVTTLIGSALIASGICAGIDSTMADPMMSRKVEKVYFFTMLLIGIFILVETCVAGIFEQ